MGTGEFEESRKFNLKDLLEFSHNAIVVKNINVQNNCVIQALVFDYGKVQPYQKLPFLRFIYIVDGKAEVVINENSTFLNKGDSILIPAYTPCSIEANHKFIMISVTVKSE